MAMTMTSALSDSHAHVIKNTFIEVVEPNHGDNRRVSIPASLRLCSADRYAQPVDDDVFSKTRSVSEMSSTISLDSKMRAVSDASTAASDFLPSSPATSTRSSEKCFPSCAFEAQRVTGLPKELRSGEMNAGNWRNCYKNKVDKVIKRTLTLLAESPSVAKVDVTEDPMDGTITIKANCAKECSADDIVTFCQKALLQAAAQCKCIYVMGYCSKQAFTEHTSGFDATLAAMENASKACWHVFKKGFCRHDAKCSKQHPVFKVPVRVLVETVDPPAPSSVASDFKLLLAGLVQTMTSALSETLHIAGARAREDAISRSWTIELELDSVEHRDYACGVAKYQFLNIMTSSRAVRIVEFGQIFTQKSDGFVALLAERETSYAQEACPVPINVVFQSR